MARKKAVKKRKKSTRKGSATAKLRGFGKSQRKRAGGARAGGKRP